MITLNEDLRFCTLMRPSDSLIHVRRVCTPAITEFGPSRRSAPGVRSLKYEQRSIGRTGETNGRSRFAETPCSQHASCRNLEVKSCCTELDPLSSRSFPRQTQLAPGSVSGPIPRPTSRRACTLFMNRLHIGVMGFDVDKRGEGGDSRPFVYWKRLSSLRSSI